MGHGQTDHDEALGDFARAVAFEPRNAADLVDALASNLVAPPVDPALDANDLNPFGLRKPRR